MGSVGPAPKVNVVWPDAALSLGISVPMPGREVGALDPKGIPPGTGAGTGAVLGGFNRAA